MSCSSAHKNTFLFSGKFQIKRFVDLMKANISFYHEFSSEKTTEKVDVKF